MPFENLLAQRMLQIPERSALVLKMHLLRSSETELAEQFGISFLHSQRLLYRALKDFESDNPRAMVDSTEMMESTNWSPNHLDLLKRLESQATEILAEVERLKIQRSNSVEYRRLDAIRHWGIIFIVAISSALYVKEHWAEWMAYLKALNLSP